MMTDHHEVARLLGVATDAFNELESKGVHVSLTFNTVMTDFGYVMNVNGDWATRMKAIDMAERPNPFGRGALA